MSSSIIFWRLSKTLDIDASGRSAEGTPVDAVRLFRDAQKLQGGTLYLVDCAMPDMGRPPQREDVAYLFFNVSADGIPFTTRADHAIVVEPLEATAMLERVFDAWDALMRWDGRMSAALLGKTTVDSLFAMGYEMLSRPFGIHDVSLRMIYRTPGFIDNLGLTEDSYAYQQIVRAHAVNAEFHRSMRYERPFEYYDEQTDTELLCVNIRYEGRFVARIVVPLAEGEEHMDPGEVQLFALYGRYVEDAYRAGAEIFQPQRRNEAIHDLFHNLAEGRKIPLDVVSDILGAYGWTRTQNYEVIVFRIHDEPGWVARGDVSRAFLCRSLEWEWPQTFSFMRDDDIVWVINLDLMGSEASEYALFQSIAAFVRDNVCNAGMSRRFNDFAELHQAVCQSDAALRIGMVRHPHFWYYRFDDYKLEYLQSKMTGNMSALQLCHPAILTLRAYDADKDTELAHTLECYLTCNQNAAATSEALFIHRSTFFRRIEHIKELTSVDLDDPEEVLYLRLSYWLISKD